MTNIILSNWPWWTGRGGCRTEAGFTARYCRTGHLTRNWATAARPPPAVRAPAGQWWGDRCWSFQIEGIDGPLSEPRLLDVFDGGCRRDFCLVIQSLPVDFFLPSRNAHLKSGGVYFRRCLSLGSISQDEFQTYLSKVHLYLQPPVFLYLCSY